MPDTDSQSQTRWLRHSRKSALAAVALLAAGGGAGAVAMQATRPTTAMAPQAPIAIRALPSSGIVTLKGRVAEIYGNKFIVADASGRALIDTGREGEGGRLVTVGEPVTVQGRFDRGFVRAGFLVRANNTVVALASPGGPHEGRGRRGPRPDRDDDLAAPPPASGTVRDDAVQPPGTTAPPSPAVPGR